MKKKIVLAMTAALAVVTLSSCKKSFVKDADTYYTFTSGTSNINPYSETLNTASDLYGYLTDSLYTGDYDWGAAKEILAEEAGKDLADMPATISFRDWYNAGKTAADLPYNRFPAMAAYAPKDVNGDGLVWEFELRKDLEFEDGTKINAETFNYSWEKLLNPLLLNDRATNLYDAANLPIKNAEAYLKQKSQKSDKFDEPMWDAGDKGIIQTSNALAFLDDGDELFYATTEGYFVYYYPSENATFGGNWALIWAAEVEGELVFGGFVSQDADGKPLQLPNGAANPEAGERASYFKGAKPALMYEDGTKVPLNDKGEPVGATAIANDPVEWSEVGFRVTGEYTFEIELTDSLTQWDVMGNLTSGITGVVHPAKYEEGLNPGKTKTTYGTIDNPLVSYGPYVLTKWQDDVLYLFERNEKHYDAKNYPIKKIRYDVIADQGISVKEFNAGRLDVVGASGEYYQQFKDNPNLKLTPVTTFFRFAFNIDPRDDKDGQVNHILAEKSFREAFYYAIDREEFVETVRPPAYANQGFIGPVYIATEYGSVAYRSSEAGVGVFADRSPETTGFDPVKAKALFDEAYAAVVAAGKITEGTVVKVEYQFYNVESNVKVANWVKTTVEAIFNEGGKKFELVLVGLSSDALDDAWDGKNFDMTFGGWQGLNFDPASLMGQVYNSISGKANILENGFDTGNYMLVVSLPNSKVALERWVEETSEEIKTHAEDPDYDSDEVSASVASQVSAYKAWVNLLEKFGVGTEEVEVDEDSIRISFDELYKAAYRVLYNSKDVNYDGKNEDFNNITAAMENALLEEMIGIPLFTSVNATVYSGRVYFEADSYHAWMGWGGMKYMRLV